MSIIIPTASSTYGDSTVTEGGGLYGKYVLAQFRGDADLEWVRELRSVLVRDELKYGDLRANRPRLKQNRQFWSKIESGVGQASVIIIDPTPENLCVLSDALQGGMSLAEIDDSPEIFERAITAMIANTPIAYLPLELAQAVPWARYDLLTDLERFTPERIREAIGGGLREARVFAARAHAVFDLTSASDSVRTDEVFKSPLSQVMLAELVSTIRSFDIESPSTLSVLNDAANQIAESIQQCLPAELMGLQRPLIREVDSRAIDEIQAADVAAGWAREMLDLGMPKTLSASFERVWLNGRRIK